MRFDKDFFEQDGDDDKRKNAPEYQESDASTIAQIESVLDQIEAQSFDLTCEYVFWMELAFSFASLGERGRSYFHRVSQFHPEYDPGKTDVKFDNALKTKWGNHTIGTFFHHAKQAGIKIPPASGFELQDIESQEPGRPFPYVVTGKELLDRDVKELPQLVDGLLMQSGVGAIAGGSDTGKSIFLRNLALSIVLGHKTFLGFKINARHNSVIFVPTEDDEDPTAFLLNKHCSKLDLPDDALEGLRYIFETDNLLKKLDEQLSFAPADIVIIDAFADLFAGELNQSNKVRSFLNDFNQLAVRHNCLFMFLHHTGKRTEEKPPNKNNLLGSQGFESKMRIVLLLRHDPEIEDLRHLCIVKGNYLPKSAKVESYVLRLDPETLTFENTGERTPFDEIVMGGKESNRKEKHERAKKLRSEGMTFDEIAAELGYKNRGTISKLFSDFGKE